MFLSSSEWGAFGGGGGKPSAKGRGMGQMVISRKRLRQLMREVEFQKMRVQSRILGGETKMGLLESQERLEDLYLLLLALYNNLPIKVTEERKRNDQDTTRSGDGESAMLAVG
jgi:hypothetical protein